MDGVHCGVFIHGFCYIEVLLSVPSGRCGEGNGNPLQCSCLENPKDRGAWWAAIHWVAQSRTRLKRLSSNSSSGWWVLSNAFSASNVLDKAVFYLHSYGIVNIGQFLYVEPFSSVTQSCPTLCDPMSRSTPGLCVQHQLLEFTQTHVHWVSDAIQASHPLSSPSPPAFSLSQHQGLFALHQVAKVLEFQLQHQSFQWTPRTDFL